MRVEWSGGWTVLITEAGRTQSASMPIQSPHDTYVIRVAGSKGQGVKASGAVGYDLTVTFVQAEK